MPERNIALLEQTLQQIKDHPELHYQGFWAAKTDCDTAYCFAGWANVLSGWQPVNWYPSTFSPVQGMGLVTGHFEKDGDCWEAEEVAAGLLGLTSREADILFEQDNTVPMLELMVKDLVNDEKLRRCRDYREEAQEG